MVAPLLRTSHHDLIANLAWASEVWHRGGADVIFLHLAVLFFNANMQRTGDRITKILNTKRSSRNLRFVNHTPHLADGHFCCGVCHAGNVWRVAAQIGRQHLIVSTDTATNIVKTIKNIGSEVILAQRQFGF